MFGGLGVNELLIALILFGGKRLPEIARGLGRGIVDFKSALHQVPTDNTQKAKDTSPDPD